MMLRPLSFTRKRESSEKGLCTALFASSGISAVAGLTSKSPALHFLLLGALLFGAKQWLPLEDPGAGLPVIRVSADDLQRLRNDWLRDTARLPTGAQLKASVERHVDDELLLREALGLGLDRTDPVARERLINNMRFAFPDSRGDDDALVDEARGLGMHSRDLVVRRRLIQLMEMRIVSGANLGEAELRDHVAQHPQRYTQPARYAFRHVFFSIDGGPENARRAATHRLKTLQATGSESISGDHFLLGNEFPARSAAEIARLFGEAFAQKLTETPVRRWAGPLRSPYGLHLVLLESIEPPMPLAFEQVQPHAAYALLAEREKAILRDELARLRARYRVEVAAPEPAEEITVGMVR